MNETDMIRLWHIENDILYIQSWLKEEKDKHTLEANPSFAKRFVNILVDLSDTAKKLSSETLNTLPTLQSLSFVDIGAEMQKDFEQHHVTRLRQLVTVDLPNLLAHLYTILPVNFDELELRHILRTIHNSQLRIRDKTLTLLNSDDWLAQCLLTDISYVADFAKKLSPEIFAKLPQVRSMPITRLGDAARQYYESQQLNWLWDVVSVDFPQLRAEIDKLLLTPPSDYAVQQGLRTARRLLSRILNDGNGICSKSTLQVVLNCYADVDDPRVQKALRVWESEGVLEFIGDDEQYVKMIYKG